MERSVQVFVISVPCIARDVEAVPAVGRLIVAYFVYYAKTIVIALVACLGQVMTNRQLQVVKLLGWRRNRAIIQRIAE
jgi:hypothetical protein